MKVPNLWKLFSKSAYFSKNPSKFVKCSTKKLSPFILHGALVIATNPLSPPPNKSTTTLTQP